MDGNAAIDGLRARAVGTWQCARDLVFVYRAGGRDPHDFEGALPEIEIPPIAHAIFAKLAPGAHWRRSSASMVKRTTGVRKRRA